MGVTVGSPSEIFIGAPGTVQFGGRELGATTGAVTVRIRPTVYTPQVNGIPGMLAKTDYLQTEEVEVEFSLLEMSKANLLSVLAGSVEAPANVVSRSGVRRYPSVMYADLVLALQGLDDSMLVLGFPNATCTSGLEFSSADDSPVAPTLIFGGRYKGGEDFWRIIRKDFTGIQYIFGMANRTDPIGTVVKRYVRALSAAGLPVTYAFAGLPTGLTGNTATGSITGTIGGTAQAFAVTITATDGVSTPVVNSFTWTTT